MKTCSMLNKRALSVLCAAFLTSWCFAQSPAPEPPAAPEDTNVTSAAEAAVENPAEEPSGAATVERSNRRHRPQREALVVFGKDAELKRGDSTQAVVVIGGSARISGKVHDAVVAIGGDVTLKDGAEASQVVAVLGGIKAEKGSKINGEAVAVGGTVEADEGAIIQGQIQDIDLGGFVLPKVQWIREWFKQCVLKMRPLAPQVGWVWLVAGGFLLFYVLLAAVFPRPIQACVDELTRRPATTFLTGLFTKLLLPVVITILSITVIGIFAVPFIAAAVLVGAIIGKIAVLEWIGLQLGRPFKAPALEIPLVGLLVGTALVWLLYMIPVLGLIVFMVLSLWGFGAAVTAAFHGLKRESPAVARPVYSTPTPAYAAAPAAGFQTSSTQEPLPSGASAGFYGAGPSAGVAAPPVVPEAISYPRAGFWERMGAGFLDLILVIILGHWVGGPPLGLLVALAYFAGLWAWRGTTIGGIVVGLKVVRLDGQPASLPVALIRGLAAAFSIIVAFLGFFWIAWDPEKQGWHDKIAGTVVIKLPRATPLICI